MPPAKSSHVSALNAAQEGKKSNNPVLATVTNAIRCSRHSGYGNNAVWEIEVGNERLTRSRAEIV